MEFVPVCFRVNVAFAWPFTLVVRCCVTVCDYHIMDIPGALFDDFMSDEFVVNTISSRLLSALFTLKLLNDFFFRKCRQVFCESLCCPSF